jgi:HAD superfamily hydrolase (TIGR01509 family)
MHDDTRLICFDLGGVLVETARRWEVGCAAAGVSFRSERHEETSWEHFAEVVDALETDALSWSDYLVQGARALGSVYSPEELGRIHEAWLLGEYPGVEAIVRSLNDANGVVSCCLSNTNRRHWQILESRPARFAAFHALQRRWNSFEMRVRKPHRDIYRRLEVESGVDPSRILFFDDREENVTAARECGWKAEVVDRDGDVAEQIRGHLAAYGVTGF